MEASTDYYKNLRNLLKAKLSMAEANSLASILTGSARTKEQEKYEKEVREMLKKSKCL